MLDQLRVEHEVVESGYEEDMDAKSDPYELAKFLALEKAKDVAKGQDDAIIIAADTFIVFNGNFIGKPKNVDDARKILRSFSGKDHLAITGLAVIDTRTNNVINEHGEAKIRIRELTDEEIEEYIATGEPLEMAGGYGLLDRGAAIMESVEGDFFSIIGFPISKLYLALKKFNAI